MTRFVLILIFILCIIPPLVYGYQYPSYGDDSFYHMERIDEIQEHGIDAPDTRYPGQNFTWLVLLPFGGSDYSFVWFNWIACGACMFMMYLFGRNLIDKQTGLAMMACGSLIAPSFISLFHNGTIYNLINFYIFGLSASFFLLRWLKTSRWYHFTISLLLFTISGIYHSSSAAIIMVSIAMFLLFNMVVSLRKHDSMKLKKLGIYLMALLAVGAIGYMLNPELRELVGFASSIDPSSGLKLNTSELRLDQQVYIGDWLLKGWSPWLGILVIVSLLILHKAKAKVNWQLVGLLGCFCLVLGIGAFTQLFYDATRFGFDLGIVMALLSAYLIVLAIRARKSVKYQAAVWSVLVLSAIPALIWFLSFNNAMTPADIEAVRYLNSIGAESYTTSSQVQHRIYDRFVDAEYRFPDAEYVVYRSNYQTVQCKPDSNLFWYNDHYPNESQLEDYANMSKLAEWEWKGTQVIIFGGN